MPRRKIEYLLLRDVKGAKRNPKGHDDETMDASLERFGFTEPGLMDERTGRLVAGHGRLERLKAREKRGEAVPDGIVAAADGWKIPVVRGWSSKDDQEADAYLVASNAVGQGLWEQEGLAELLGDLMLSDDALAGTGFTSHDLDDLMLALAPPPDIDTLGDELGDATDEDFWPVVRARLDPETHRLFIDRTDESDDTSDEGRLRFLLS